MSTIPGASVAGTTTTIPNTSSNAAGTASTGTSNNTSKQLSLASNFNTFLNLLTTQLQNQDPVNPVDSTQFTQQLVAFAGVQQQVEGNTYLQQILSAVQGNQVGSASSYIGTHIQASGNQGSLSGGNAVFGYNLPAAASDVKVVIKDSSGAVVFNGTGTGKSGDNTVTWDGTNSFTGVTQPDGVYSVSVTAKDINGKSVIATPFVTGTVTSASISGGTVMLNIGNLQIPTTDVTTITNLPAKTT